MMGQSYNSSFPVQFLKGSGDVSYNVNSLYTNKKYQIRTQSTVPEEYSFFALEPLHGTMLTQKELGHEQKTLHV